MLWFNVAKDLGALRAEDEVFDVPGAAFAPGEKPLGRCAGQAVEFDLPDDGAVTGLTFVPEVAQRRARPRHRR